LAGKELQYPHHTVPAPDPRFPKRMEAQGFVSKKQAGGKADREMIADGTQN
jgi:hypothetical protein